LLPSASTISPRRQTSLRPPPRFELQGDAELARTHLQDQKKRAPGAAAKAVAADPMHRSLEVNGNVVPIGKLFGDAPIARRIVLFEIVQRRIGKNHAEAKVSSARLRSYTVISVFGRCFLRRIAAYRPAGPPPMIAIFMKPPAGSMLDFILSLKQFPRQALSCRPFGVKLP